MRTNFFNEQRQKVIEEMAKEGNVYEYVLETTVNGGLSQTTKTDIVKSPQDAINRVEDSKIAYPNQGYTYEVDEHYKGKELNMEVGETLCMFEACLTTSNGKKFGHVGYLKRLV